MFDMSWGEVMVIGAVALIVIGPKDLPKALRTVGQVTGKVRRMASEFQTQFNDAMREAELDEVRKQVEGINQSVSSSLNTGFNPMQTIRDELKGAVEANPAAGATADVAPHVPEVPVAAVAPDATPSFELPPPLDPVDAASPMPRPSSERAAAEPVTSPDTPPSHDDPPEKAGTAKA